MGTLYEETEKKQKEVQELAREIIEDLDPEHIGSITFLKLVLQQGLEKVENYEQISNLTFPKPG